MAPRIPFLSWVESKASWGSFPRIKLNLTPRTAAVRLISVNSGGYFSPSRRMHSIRLRTAETGPAELICA